jgi:hypothetical protein
LRGRGKGIAEASVRRGCLEIGEMDSGKAVKMVSLGMGWNCIKGEKELFIFSGGKLVTELKMRSIMLKR